MRTMYDSVTPGNIPFYAEMVAGYVDPDGTFTWSDADWAMFPNATKVRIAGHAWTNDGHVLDVEDGDATPDQAPRWCEMRRAAGVTPTVYCSWALWGVVRAQFQMQGVAEPEYWIAAYPGIGEALYDGAVAHQFIDDGPYDRSMVADFWPGVDEVAPPPPTPPTPKREDEGMEFFTVDGVDYHLWVGADGHARYRAYHGGTPAPVIDISAGYNVLLDPNVALGRVDAYGVIAFYGASHDGTAEVVLAPGPYGYFAKLQ